jgi:hypothetical protein
MAPFVLVSQVPSLLCSTTNRSSRIQGRRLPSICFLLLFGVGIGNAQGGQTPGIQMFSTRQFNIDLASSSMTVAFPIRSKAGKIPVSYSLTANYGISTGLVAGLPSIVLSPSVLMPQLNAHTYGYTVAWTTTTVLSCDGS